MVLRPNGTPLVVTHDAAGARGTAWEGMVAQEAHVAMVAAGIALTRNPVTVIVDFYVPRNVGHYGTGRNARELKPSAPAVPAVRPDVDKWLRRVLDALSGVVYADDGQVVEVVARKRYGDPARAEIAVKAFELHESDAGQLTIAA